nr:hypothetical protein CFP56_00253 [Quercus suber]
MQDEDRGMKRISLLWIWMYRNMESLTIHPVHPVSYGHERPAATARRIGDGAAPATRFDGRALVQYCTVHLDRCISNPSNGQITARPGLPTSDTGRSGSLSTRGLRRTREMPERNTGATVRPPHPSPTTPAALPPSCPKLTLSPLCVRRHASASVGEMSIVSMRLHSFFFSACGTVLVTTSLRSWLPFSFSIAFPDRMPCVTMAIASRAPCSMTTSAALTSVPHVSAMSSTMIAMRSRTSPTSTMRDTSFGRARSLWIRAKPRSSPSAIDVALAGGQCCVRYLRENAEGKGKNTPLRAASVRADDHAFLDLQVLSDPPQRAWFGIEVVHGHVEEALDLRRVQVHGDDMVAARGLQHVGHQLGRDRSSTLILLVLAGVGEVGQHGRDAAGGGGATGVDQDQQLHDMIVDVSWIGRLENEDCRVLPSVLSGAGCLKGSVDVPSSSRTLSPMDMLDSLLEYCSTMILASSMPSLLHDKISPAFDAMPTLAMRHGNTYRRPVWPARHDYCP